MEDWQKTQSEALIRDGLVGILLGIGTFAGFRHCVAWLALG
jgi:hypothetical protein